MEGTELRHAASAIRANAIATVFELRAVLNVTRAYVVPVHGIHSVKPRSAPAARPKRAPGGRRGRRLLAGPW
jgi:hypothetical protein